MKNEKFPCKLFCIVSSLVSLVLIGGCFSLASLPMPSNPNNTCSVSSTEISGWFRNGLVTLNGEVKPAESDNFSNSPNCDFYKWSAQMFLWLTSPAPSSYGGTGELVFNSPAFYDVSPKVNGQRVFIPH